ncbi:DUF6248 family natural product biosynthesis protein [Actinomadura sp. 21ATH]|uniref:DUF6248 family natural product biosynthesis protein n=1 Tax=Actinomadura sp. 21ATH TaxID=1735444 RepID=UPI0035C10D66
MTGGFTLGQRIGSLTVTQVTRHGLAERVRCDCGTDLSTRLEHTFLAPPEKVGHFHAPWLLAAEKGHLRYDLGQYKIHALPNNAIDALWRGLLVDASPGPVLTELGAHMLAHWKEREAVRLAGKDSTAHLAAAGPPPFTDDRAAWIREHAWPAAMRRTYGDTPGIYTGCPCQSGPSTWCETGRHDRCGRGEPLRSVATYICSRGGDHPATFREPYAHKTDCSATVPQHTNLAQVWLADRVCRWICPCDCHTAPAGPQQLDLFATAP